jgi:nicotinate phosphoribosyltransferase
MSTRFHTASDEEIARGKVTDVYFERTVKVLKEKGIRKRVRAEFIAKKLPEGIEWAILGGIEECTKLLSGLPVNFRAMEEGSVFGPLEPVMEVEGIYTDFAVFETALLGMICQASGVVTRAARCKKAAGDRAVISFGARRMHPAVAPMIERSAYIGGCDGVAVRRSAELIGAEPVGTMPHALILVMGNTVDATKAFHEVMEKKVKRIALIDTFQDEKFETLNVAEALGGDLFAVRLDTPASRRGDFLQILKEVRWELDLRGHRDVKLYVSGGLDDKDILHLNPVVDGYGVGTFISNAPVVDFSMDIIEVEGAPLAKRGKWSGAKRVVFCPKCRTRRILPWQSTEIRCDICGEEWTELLVPLMENGKVVRPLHKPATIREFVLNELQWL